MKAIFKGIQILSLAVFIISWSIDYSIAQTAQKEAKADSKAEVRMEAVAKEEESKKIEEKKKEEGEKTKIKEQERLERLKKLEAQKKVDERFGIKKPGDFKERAIEALKILSKRLSDAAADAAVLGIKLPSDTLKEVSSLIEGIKNAIRDNQFETAQKLSKQLYDKAMALLKLTGPIPPQLQSKADEFLSKTNTAFEAKDLMEVGDIVKALNDEIVKMKKVLKSKAEVKFVIAEASGEVDDLISLIKHVEEAAIEAKKHREEADEELEAFTLAESLEEVKRSSEAIKEAAYKAQESAKGALQRAEKTRKRALGKNLKEELQAADKADEKTNEALRNVDAALENALKAAQSASEKAKMQLQEVKSKLADQREIKASVDSVNALIKDVRENAQKAAENSAELAKRLAEAAKRAEEKAKESQSAEVKDAENKAKEEAKKAEEKAKLAQREAIKRSLEVAKEVSENAKDLAESAAKAAKEKAEKAEKEAPKAAQKLAREAAAQLEETGRRFEEAKVEFESAQKHFIEAKKSAIDVRRIAETTKDPTDIAAAEAAEKLALEAEALAKSTIMAKIQTENSKAQAEQAAADAGTKASDTNGDGKRDIFDIVVVAIKFGAKDKTELIGAEDINGDGEVSIFDIVLSALGFAGEKVIIPPTEAELKSEGVVIIKISAPEAAPIFDSPNSLNYAYQSRYLSYPSILQNAYQALKAQAQLNSNSNPEIQKTLSLLEQLLWGKTTNSITNITNITSITKNVLLQNYPNPFNPETWIPFELSQNSKTDILIYNSLGQHIRALDLGYLSRGSYINREKAAYWDGKNSSGEQASSGIYFYSIKAGSFVDTKKMIIVK